VDRVEELLQAGANPNVPETARHWSPLIEAAYGNWAEIAHLLLEAGANLYCKTNAGESVLRIAMQQYSFDVMDVLRDHGFDPSRVNYSSREIATCGMECTEFVRWIASLGVDTDVHDGWGTPLRWAAYHGDVELAAELIKLGARPRPSVLRSAIFSEIFLPNDELLKIVLEAGADMNAALREAVRGDWIGVVDGLLELGADPNGVDEQGHSILYIAQRQNKFPGRLAEIVKRLKEHGAVYNTFDELESDLISS
jgi:ankyrin repeat protein